MGTYFNVDNGGNQTVESITVSDYVIISTPPTLSTHAATKSYVDAAINGLDWQESIKSFYDPTPGLPGGPSTGDRYIASATASGWTINYIYQFNSVTWDEVIPDDGTALWDEDTAGQYVWNGVAWVTLASAVPHNLLGGLDGGALGEYYHFDNAQYIWLVAHTTDDGSQHSFINQDVTSSGAPSFSALTITSIMDLQAAIATLMVPMETDQPLRFEHYATPMVGIVGQGQIYCQDVGAGNMELFYFDESANEVQLTNRGTVDISSSNLDELPDGATYGRVLLTSLINSEVSKLTDVTAGAGFGITVLVGGVNRVLTMNGDVALNQDLETTDSPTFQMVTVTDGPLVASDVTRKDYVDSLFIGWDFQEAVLDRFDPTSALPAGPTTGDRYISLATAGGWTIDNIYEWSGAAWVESVAVDGWLVYVIGEDAYYLHTSTGWVILQAGSNKNGGYIHIQTVSVDTWTVTHNLNSKYVNVTVYNSSDEVVTPTSITVNTADELTVVLSGADTGRVVVTAPVAVAINSYLHTQAAANTTWTVVHNLNNKYVNFKIYGSTDEEIFAQSATATDANTLTLTFSEAITGKVRVQVTGESVLDLYATKAYVNNLFVAWDWQDAVLERYDPTPALPVGPTVGDRYLATATANGWTIDYIYEWDSGLSWVPTAPSEGMVVYSINDDKHYIYNAVNWINFASGGGSSAGYIHTQALANATWTVQHNLNSKYLNVTVYDSSDEVVTPTTIEATDLNTLTITFGAPDTGKVVVSAPTTNAVNSYLHTEAIAAATWTVVHNLATKYVTFKIYDAADVEIFADTATATDANTLTLTFAPAIAGKVVVIGTGAAGIYTADTIYEAESGQGVTIADELISSAGFRWKRTATAIDLQPDAADDCIIAVTDTSVARTITLPTAAVFAGKIFIVLDESGGAGANPITIDTQGAELINGLASVQITDGYGYMWFESNGTNWFIINSSD